MSILLDEIAEAGTIAIGGHIRPDGDCVGACMGLYGYLSDNYPDCQAAVYLEELPEAFSYLNREEAFTAKIENCDLFISLDCGATDRLGDSEEVFQKAKRTLNIDHHISNEEFADVNYVEPKASSTCEVLCGLLEMDKIGSFSAQAFYTGIIHDTGVFKHSNTSRRTMEYAGQLMEKGIPFGRILDESFYYKTFKQLQIMGRCLLESVRIMDGKCIFSVVTRRVLEFYDARPSDLSGVIDELRTTEGVEVAILLTEKDTVEYKVSMRSNSIVDVNKIAVFFGGGGHIRAAGCEIKGSAFDVINNITEHIEKQLGEA